VRTVTSDSEEACRKDFSIQNNPTIHLWSSTELWPPRGQETYTKIIKNSLKANRDATQICPFTPRNHPEESLRTRRLRCGAHFYIPRVDRSQGKELEI